MFYIYFITAFVSTREAYIYTLYTILELPGLWHGYMFTFLFLVGRGGRLDFDLFNFQIIICFLWVIRHNFIKEIKI